jgi:hypothetical protein
MRIWIETIAPGTDEGARAVPAMIRRRLSAVGKLALGALAGLDPAQHEPMVFASSWGDADKGAELLSQAAAEGSVSPMGFSGSVHNAVGAIASIWLKNKLAYRSVSAGCETTESGLVEAAMELQAHDSVLFVRYEGARPALYSGLALPDLPHQAYAWACRIVKGPSLGAALCVELTRIGAAAGAPDFDAASEIAFLGDPSATVLQHGPWLWKKVSPCS